MPSQIELVSACFIIFINSEKKDKYKQSNKREMEDFPLYELRLKVNREL